MRFFEKTLDKGTVNLVISEYIEITEMLVRTKITYNPDPGGPEIHFPLGRIGHPMGHHRTVPQVHALLFLSPRPCPPRR